MTGRVAEVFANAARDGRAVLVGYLPAGFPAVDTAVAAMRAMVEGGVDVVEVGLPYSDPLIDGPVIQAAVDRALAGGTRVSDVLATVEAVASAGAPVLVMTYWNPIERYGVERFAAALAAAGGSGMITPDLTPEEAGPWLAAAEKHGLDPVFLVAPSSSDDRIRRVGATGRGFIYAASTMGVTGARERVSARAPELVARAKALVSLPVAVGLGVSNAEQAAEVAGYADGVIVGSAFVRCLDEAGVDGVHGLAEALASGVRRRV
ncbi:MAG TPA: tryptophan synthase subunit alpha [Mycobacteriales bacterium]|nr:tryptophan synthase subunit alpha [Mycobacteriales bacterium]